MFFDRCSRFFCPCPAAGPPQPPIGRPTGCYRVPRPSALPPHRRAGRTVRTTDRRAHARCSRLLESFERNRQSDIPLVIAAVRLVCAEKVGAVFYVFVCFFFLLHVFTRLDFYRRPANKLVVIMCRHRVPSPASDPAQEVHRRPSE